MNVMKVEKMTDDVKEDGMMGEQMKDEARRTDGEMVDNTLLELV